MKKISKVNGWWAKNFTGKAEALNDKFSVHFGETFVDFHVSELIPDKKVVWKVTDCNLHWINKKEWKERKWFLKFRKRKIQHKLILLMLVWCRVLNAIMIVKQDGMAMLRQSGKIY